MDQSACVTNLVYNKYFKLNMYGAYLNMDPLAEELMHYICGGPDL